ncbi:hypothetical protein ABBQ32_002375 [Trebouxia sp. C0010 RCD-2024]
MPRAVDSFVLALTKKRCLPSIKFGEVILFSLCMGGLMYYRQHEPDTMAPLLNTLISRIVFGQTTKRRPELPRPASITFSEGDFPGGHQQWGSYPSQLASLGNSPTQGTPRAAPRGTGSGQGSAAQPSLPGNGTSGKHALVDAPTLEEGLLRVPAGQGNTTTAPEATWRGGCGGRREQGQGMADGTLQMPSSKQSASPGPAAAPITADVNDGGNGHAQYGFNGSRDGNDAAAAASYVSHGASPASRDGKARAAQMADIQAGTGSSHVPLSDSIGRADATERPVSEQNSFIELVQGTEQLLGMLGARDVS